ncbi:unnamed protein product [Clavelina lepadiformis]|uniref:Pentraxin (PTX) domain-containing protein n=1 Tax=Clavelina lepadiformis TaxID=159417 RepID=A0ABP0FIR7_CLALP
MSQENTEHKEKYTYGLLESLQSFQENHGSVDSSIQADELKEMPSSTLEDAIDVIQQNLSNVGNSLNSNNMLSEKVAGNREKMESSSSAVQNVTNLFRNKVNSTGSVMSLEEEGEFSGLLNVSRLSKSVGVDSANTETKHHNMMSKVQGLANRLDVNIPVASKNHKGALQSLQTLTKNDTVNRDKVTESSNGLLRNVTNHFRNKLNSTGSVMPRAEESKFSGLLKNLPPLADSMEGDSNKTEHQNKMSTMQSLANKLGVSIPVASNNQAVSSITSPLKVVLNKHNKKPETFSSNRNQNQLLKRTQSDLSHVRPFQTNIYYFKESETKNSKKGNHARINRSRGNPGSNAKQNTNSGFEKDVTEEEMTLTTAQSTSEDATDADVEHQTNGLNGIGKTEMGLTSCERLNTGALKSKDASGVFARLGDKLSRDTFWKLMAVVTLVTCAATIATVVTQVDKPFALQQTETSHEEENDTFLTMFETTCPGVSLRFPRGFQTTDYARYRGTGFFTRLSEATFCLWIDTEYMTRGSVFVSYATRTNDNELTLRFNSQRPKMFRLDLAGVRLDFPVDDKYTTGHEHLCASFSTTLEEVVFYVQGEIVGRKRYRGHSVLGGGDLILGQEQDTIDANKLNPEQAFRGTITDFLLWPNILSEADIKAIYYRCHCPLDYRVNLSMDSVELFGATEHFVNGTCPTFV